MLARYVVDIVIGMHPHAVQLQQLDQDYSLLLTDQVVRDDVQDR